MDRHSDVGEDDAEATPFAVEPPEADLDEVFKAHEVIMAISLQHLLEEVQEELPTA